MRRQSRSMESCCDNVDFTSLGVSSFEPRKCTGEMNASEKVSYGFFVACCNSPEVFDGVEETLDEVAFCIEHEIALPPDLAI